MFYVKILIVNVISQVQLQTVGSTTYSAVWSGIEPSM